MLPGVVETGLFCGMAERAYFGMADGTVTVLNKWRIFIWLFTYKPKGVIDKTEKKRKDKRTMMCKKWKAVCVWFVWSHLEPAPFLILPSMNRHRRFAMTEQSINRLVSHSSHRLDQIWPFQAWAWSCCAWWSRSSPCWRCSQGERECV